MRPRPSGRDSRSARCPWVRPGLRPHFSVLGSGPRWRKAHAVSVGCGHRERAAEANVARMGVIVVLGTDASRAGIQSRAGRGASSRRINLTGAVRRRPYGPNARARARTMSWTTKPTDSCAAHAILNCAQFSGSKSRDGSAPQLAQLPRVTTRPPLGRRQIDMLVSVDRQKPL